MANLSASVHFDWVLAPYDIAQSKAHARVLHGAGLLTKDELKTMVTGLDTLLENAASGKFIPTPADEDVHSALANIFLVSNLSVATQPVIAGSNKCKVSIASITLSLSSCRSRL